MTLSLQENLFIDILRDFLSTEILKRFFLRLNWPAEFYMGDTVATINSLFPLVRGFLFFELKSEHLDSRGAAEQSCQFLKRSKDDWLTNAKI